MELDESVLSLDVQDETAKTAQRYGGTHGGDNRVVGGHGRRDLNTEPDQKDSLGLPRRALPTTTTSNAQDLWIGLRDGTRRAYLPE
ncbi:hypothetical protein [Streptomyces atratus]|uniref:hypothetical protein n=1 Tax=Streptomyces atratus TaxID=1893 RepID=UPI0021A8570D|nr:hypothetical protein [Streptomyces atratus]MCT2543314.1 hypothetical protein [Streptomyces atratus]